MNTIKTGKRRFKQYVLFYLLSFALMTPGIIVTYRVIFVGIVQLSVFMTILTLFLILIAFMNMTALMKKMKKTLSMKGKYIIRQDQAVCAWCGTPVYQGYCASCHIYLDHE